MSLHIDTARAAIARATHTYDAIDTVYKSMLIDGYDVTSTIVTSLYRAVLVAYDALQTAKDDLQAVIDADLLEKLEFDLSTELELIASRRSERRDDGDYIDAVFETALAVQKRLIKACDNCLSFKASSNFVEKHDLSILVDCVTFDTYTAMRRKFN